MNQDEFGVPVVEEREQCEALVQGSAAARPNNDLQCSRLSIRLPEFADVVLCYQHMEMAEQNEELELTGGRTLVLVEVSFDEESRVSMLAFRVVSNVSHLHRARSAPATRKDLARQLVIRQFGSVPHPGLVDSFAKNDALMELAAQDMFAAQRAITESLERTLGMNITEFPDHSDHDET